ncbi:hypothetical protein [Embleya sp. NPDC005971]|uniref:hypothetical protein n=1 Tax=Embleya sp. NPDC005971 TaxID=3156724 RepID=UPI00340D681C
MSESAKSTPPKRSTRTLGGAVTAEPGAGTFEDPTPPVAPAKPAARKRAASSAPARTARKTAGKKDDPAKTTLDLDPDKYRDLRVWGIYNENAKAVEIMRALVDAFLEDPEGLGNDVLDRILAAREARKTGKADSDED